MFQYSDRKIKNGKNSAPTGWVEKIAILSLTIAFLNLDLRDLEPGIGSIQGIQIGSQNFESDWKWPIEVFKIQKNGSCVKKNMINSFEDDLRNFGF